MDKPDKDTPHIDLRNIPKKEWGKRVLQAVEKMAEITNGEDKEKTIH